MSPSLIIDLVAVLVLLVFVILGAKKGFVLTLCGLLAIFVAFIGATFLANTFSGQLADVIRPTIESHIDGVLTKAIQQSSGGTMAGQVAKPEDLSLNNVLEVLQSSDVYRSLAESFQNAVSDGLANVAGSAAKSVSDYVSRELARAAIFFLGFVLILILWTLLSHALDLVAKLPVLNTFNRTGGGVIGAVKGFLILCVAAWLLYTVTGVITSETAEDSFVLPYLLHPVEQLHNFQLSLG